METANLSILLVVLEDSLKLSMLVAALSVSIISLLPDQSFSFYFFLDLLYYVRPPRKCDRNGWRCLPSLVPGLRGEARNVLPLRMVLVGGFILMPLIAESFILNGF